MISKSRRSLLSLAIAASTLGTAAWSPDAQACSTEPYMASICIMSWPRTAAFGGSLYTAASGQLLSINEYQALYSIIGNTYGGTQQSGMFGLPDLRGRVIVGVGQGPGLPLINFGTKGGVPAVVLSTANLPAHSHTLGDNAMTVTGPGDLDATASLGTLMANTTIGTLAVSTTAGTLGATSSITGLTATLNASSGAATSGTPAGAALPTNSAVTKTYASVLPPNVTMATGSVTISGGTVTTTVTGSPTSALSGSPTTMLTGAPEIFVTGGPSVSLTGATDTTPASGTTQPVATMPPYTALVYYIATGGIYPSPD